MSSGPYPNVTKLQYITPLSSASPLSLSLPPHSHSLGSYCAVLSPSTSNNHILLIGHPSLFSSPHVAITPPSPPTWVPLSHPSPTSPSASLTKATNLGLLPVDKPEPVEDLCSITQHSGHSPAWQHTLWSYPWPHFIL